MAKGEIYSDQKYQKLFEQKAELYNTVMESADSHQMECNPIIELVKITEDCERCRFYLMVEKLKGEI